MTYILNTILACMACLGAGALIAAALVTLSVWIGGERSNWKDPS